MKWLWAVWYAPYIAAAWCVELLRRVLTEGGRG